MTDEELRKLFEETRRQITDETRRHVDERVSESTSEMRRHLDVYAEDVNRKFELVAEGLQSLNDKIEREASDIRDEMRRGFADTHAMIKFSHVEPDRRIAKLEDKAEKLEERVDRLESTH